MAEHSKIEWTDSTWNPIRARYWEMQDDGSGKERIGWHCVHVSEACRNCYAEGINRRLGTGLDFKPGNLFRPERVGYANGEAKLFLDETMLARPLTWRRPRMIFVCSMTDLFADFVPDEWIDRVFAVMALAPRHIFQVLTKRPERMRTYLCDAARVSAVLDACLDYVSVPGAVNPRLVENGVQPLTLPNVWLGTSVEDQRRADERIPLLLDTPAAVRWISAEPLLGPVDLRHWLGSEPVIPGLSTYEDSDGFVRQDIGGGIIDGLDWVVAGGESGPGARPTNPQWFRDLRDQCEAADVPFFFKQNGEWVSVSEVAGPGEHFKFPDGRTVRRIGKRLAGRTLDGRTHDAMPGRDHVRL